MKKIPTIFQRTEDRRHVRDEVVPGCEWVLRGEGVATRKYDGTCVMIAANGQAYARRELKKDTLAAPPGFILADRDEATGKVVGWEPAEQSGFARYITEAIGTDNYAPGTFELCGPKVQGNPEQFNQHLLIRHSHAEVISPPPPLTFSGLRDWMQRTPYEGIVWHHPDGRMAKLKRRDFPIKQKEGSNG